MNDMSDFNDFLSKMEEFDNREKYTKITKNVLDSIPDNKLEQAIIDFIIDEKIKDNYESEYKIVRSLSKGLQYVYATWLLEGEVNNGGFNQYFYNSAGDFKKEALEGLEHIGATENAKLLSEAIHIYNREKEMHDRVKKKGTIKAFSESYDETELTNLDERFYSLAEDLSKLRIDYIRNNAEEFIDK